MIVVNKYQSGRIIIGDDSRRLRHVRKSTPADIPKQKNPVAHRDSKVGQSVIVEVPDGTGYAIPTDFQSSLAGGTNSKAPVPRIPVHLHGGCSAPHYKQVGSTISHHVDQTRSMRA